MKCLWLEKYLKIELNSSLKNNDPTHYWKNIISESNDEKTFRYWKK
jgi:hypothetical protein